MSPRAREGWLDVAHELLGRQTVREVSEALRPSGIDVMPLKGVFLHARVYTERHQRRLSDVDVLVSPRRFEEARAELKRAGFSHEQPEAGAWQVTLKKPSGGLGVDLHRSFTATPRSCLDPDAMFAAGEPDEELFGARVVLPNRYDFYAHLLLHFASTRLLGGAVHHPEDFPASAAALELGPERCAQRLRVAGLARHAHFALPMVAERTKDPFVPRLLAHLPMGAVDRLAVRAALAAERGPVGSMARRLAALGLVSEPHTWFRILGAAPRQRWRASRFGSGASE